GCRAVLALPDGIDPKRKQALRCLLLLGWIEPGVGPDDLHGGAGMGCLRSKRDRVDLADDFWNRERSDEPDLAFLAGGAKCHAGQVVGVLRSTEVLAHVVGGLGAGRLLEFHVWMFLRLAIEGVLESERGAEYYLVAVADQVFDHLRYLGPFGDVLFIGGLHAATQLLLRVLAALVVGLSPTVVRGGTDVNPGGLVLSAAAAGVV